jgi:enoyl-CoA hydratase/carnithine racemase
MTEQVVDSQIADGIAILTLNNPAKRNALSTEMMGALIDALETCGGNAQVRVIILRAIGPVFSAGHDLRELVDHEQEEYENTFNLCTNLMMIVRQMDQPVIAEVRGLATAAGCQLVAACDLAVASEDAHFATPGVNIGLFCTTPGIAVSRAVPRKKAMEMLLTGDPISAVEAERVGLVNRVVPADQLEETTLFMAERIASSSGQTIKLGKDAFYRQIEMNTVDAYRFGQSKMVENLGQADAQEGIQAFLEKRKPRWTN